MQRVFGEPGSAWFAPRFAGIIGNVRRWSARSGRGWPSPGSSRPAPAGAWRRYYEQWPFALQPPGARIYELVDEFAAEPGPTVDATTFSKWSAGLRERVGAGRLVLAGVSTDCCVLSTAVAAADDGVAVQVVADACAGVNDESHAQALDILRLYAPLIEVVSTADVLTGRPRPGDGR